MKTLILIVLLAAPFISQGSSSSLLHTKLISENGTNLSGVTIYLNETKLQVTENPEATIKLGTAKSYQIKLTKDGYYPRVQTFSAKEIAKMQTSQIIFTLIPRKKNRVMLAFGGDVMMGRRYYKPYFDDDILLKENSELLDSKAILAQVKPYLSAADIAAVNLESQISEEKPIKRAPKLVTFYSKPSVVKALKWAGIDYVTLGNNHTYDYLDEGLSSTIAALNNEDLPFSGAGHNEQQALKPHMLNVNSNNLAMLGYVGWQGSTTPKQTANQYQGGAAFGSSKNINSSVQQAIEQKQLPIVQYHGSLEYSNEPTGVTEQRLKSAIDNGAVLAVAHHPHVTQGIELYNNRLIAYSMGNFVFDQNFSSTQHSYLLYVWLDDGEFHRAEIVPIYVKGYKPTPAIDEERITILKRVKTLSSKRNTHIKNHLGHGVILPSQQSPKQSKAVVHTLDISTEKTHSLSIFPWDTYLETVNSQDSSIQYRLGTNLINGSTFDHFSAFGANERGFLFDKANSNLISSSEQNNLALSMKVNQPLWFGMKHFRRVYKPSNPVTFKANIKANKNVSIKLYWQGRKTKQKLFDAFENSPKHFINSYEINAENQWKNIEVDFNSPRIGYRSYRVLAEISSVDGTESLVTLDNVSLIEWQTAFQSNSIPHYFSDISKMATFIGFNKTSQLPITISAK